MDLKEEDIVVSKSSKSDTNFDRTIGHIEDIIMEEEFQMMQTDFMEKHYQEFEDTEENKLSYTEIQKAYTELVESYIGRQLSERMPAFVMAEFEKQLVARKNELEGEVFEMLETFSDFLAFKEMMLDFRAEKEGRTVDLSSGLTVTSLGNQMGESNGCSGLSLGPGVSGQGSGNHVSLINSDEPMVEGGSTPRSLAAGEPAAMSTAQQQQQPEEQQQPQPTTLDATVKSDVDYEQMDIAMEAPKH